MLHWRARRLLPRLLDDDGLIGDLSLDDHNGLDDHSGLDDHNGLNDELRLEVEVHAASCARCRRVQREFELSERLLQGMPTAFGPLEFDPNTYARLVALNRWSSDPSYPRRDRYNAPILALASALVIVLMAATMSHWSPTVESLADPITLAAGQPDTTYVPATWSSGRY